jgi:hypothetical protein
MPYSVKKPPKDLVKKIKKRHPKATINEVRQFVHVFNGAIKDGDSESRAFAKAWGVLNQNEKLKSSHVKTNKKETIKKVEKAEKKEKRKNKKKKKASLAALTTLVSLSNELDSIGLHNESSYIEELVRSYYGYTQ